MSAPGAPVFRGRLVGIYVVGDAGAPMTACATVAAQAGLGLAGDRYALGTGTYSASGRGPRDVTQVRSAIIVADQTCVGC